MLKPRSIATLVWLLIAANFAFAQSHSPLPRKLQGSQKPQGQATQNQEKSQPDIRGTRQAPLIIETLPATKSAEQAAHEHYEHFEKPSLDRGLTYATIGLVAVTGFLSIFTFLLWGATRKLVIDAKETSRRQLRAYISERFSDLPKKTNDGRFLIQGDIENSGVTPGYNVRAWADAALLKTDEYEQHAFPQPDRPITPFACNPHGIHSQTVVLSADEYQIADPFKKLYLWGRIDFEDAFGSQHWKTYRLYLRDEGGHANWAYCEQGNNEDHPKPPRRFGAVVKAC